MLHHRREVAQQVQKRGLATSSLPRQQNGELLLLSKALQMCSAPLVEMVLLGAIS
jgi:hypothetical protein